MTGKKSSWLRRISKTIGYLLLAIVLLVAVVVIFEIPVSLKILRGPIASAASEALGREFVIDGPITLVPSTPPAVEIGGIHIGNPAGWPQADLAALNFARASVAVLPLLKGEIIIDEISVEGLAVNLETNAAGEPNWLLGDPDKKPEAEPKAEQPAQQETPAALNYLELRELSLNDIALTHRAADSDKTLEFKIDTVSGSALDQEPLQLTVDGSLQDVPYNIKLKGDSIAALLAGNQPWSLDVALEMLGATFKIDGEMAAPLRGQGLNVAFELNTPKLEDMAALFATKLPPVGAVNLTGLIEQVEGKMQLRDLKGELATAKIDGHFEADFSGPKPRFLGDLALLSIDAGPFLVAAGSNVPEADAGDADDKKVNKEDIDLDQPILILDSLNKIDAQFKLSIAEILNTNLGLRDASFEVTVADGRLNAPMKVIVAEVGFNGEASLTPGENGPEVMIRLAAEASDIGDLAESFAGVSGIAGEFNGAELKLSAQGETIRSLTTTTALEFDMAGASLSYGNDSGGRPVEFSLDQAQMLFPATEDSKISAEGALLGEAFTLTMTGGTFLENIIKRRWPVKLQATGGGAELNLDANVGKGGDGVSAISINLSGEKIGGLARWLGTSPEASAAYQLSGEITLDQDGVITHLKELQLGETSATGELGLRKENDQAIPFVKLEVATVDVAELVGLFAKTEQDNTAAEPDDNDTQAVAPPSLTVDIPILPNGLVLRDVDLDVAVETIKMEPVLSNLSLSGKIRDGFVDKTPFALTVEELMVNGEFSADLRSAQPEIDLTLGSENVDIGALMSRLGVSSGLQASAGKLDLIMALRGQTTRDILTRSAFSANLHNAALRLGEAMTVTIPKGTIKADADQPISLTLDGLLDNTPVAIQIQTDSLASFAEVKEQLEMSLDIALANATLKLNGATPLPVQPKTLAFNMDLRGKRFSDFNQLLGASLPPFGPYRWRGTFGSRKSGLYVKNLDLSVGNSTLGGALNLDTTQQPPMLTVDLVAKSIQLDDFKTDGWSPDQAGSAGGAAVSGGDANILRIQQALVAQGYDTGGVDGIMGDATKKAIADFQNNEDMEPSGVPDQAFVAALFDEKPTAEAEPETDAAPETETEGDTNNATAFTDVDSSAWENVEVEKVLRIQIQQRLVNLGYDTGGIDGILGGKSQAAIRDFQKQQGLAVTGKPDPEVLALLLGSPGTTAAPEKPAIAEAEKPAVAAVEKAPARKASGAPAALLSPETLSRLNSKVTLEVEEVVSGQDQLGQGSLVATLQDGRINVDPLTVAVPGGSVEIGLSLKPGNNSIALGARANIDQFDYGILARRLDPQSEVGGRLSLKMELQTQGPPGQLLDTANGHIDFAAIPKDMNAGIFDLWAVNLVSSLMPALDGESDSKLNCIVARFDINDGIMTPTALLIDSTNVQASGDGVVNFKTDSISFKAAPEAKKPQMFSAQTPVEIQGQFTDFKVGLPTGALAGTAIRMLTSPFTTPFKRLFTKDEPSDGRIACKQAWLKPPEPEEDEPAVENAPGSSVNETTEPG